ncbi:aldo/keto reductase [Treponema sp. OttesenSCG-928-L16]|nr:aldo/keto reductase [Treponema sp. OttesenSCG-928-L16]
MEYRNIGKTGMAASIIGLGAEHLDNKPYAVVEETIHAALDNEINIIDVFMPGSEVRTNIGKALKGRRDKVLIQGHVGSVDLKEQYDISRDLSVCRKYFEELLRCLDTDYIDFGMLFFMDSEEALKQIYDNGIVDYVLELKRKGTIRAIGASSHNPRIARRLAETGLVDLFLFSINPAFDMTPADKDVLSTFDDTQFPSQQYGGIDPDRADFYALCEQKGIAITVMKTLGGGRLLSAGQSPFGQALSAGQCIHYALTRPAVVSALIGCQSRVQVEEAVHYLDLSEQERDYSALISGYQGNFRGNCVYCNHCLPCPADIDIAMVNKYLDIALVDQAHIPPSIAQHYSALKAHGSDCISCGSCEGKCPFAVPVIERMQKAAALFGK